MVDSLISNILYGQFQCVASKFPPKLDPGGQERALVPLVILNFEFRAPTATLRGRAESRESGHQAEDGLLQLLQPWVMTRAKF